MNSPTANRMRVNMGKAAPTSGHASYHLGGNGKGWLAEWPCRKDHHPDNITTHKDKWQGQKLVCRICSAEARKENREKNKAREHKRSKERYRRKKERSTAAQSK